MAFINTLVARAASGIWGLKLGSATYQAVIQQATAPGASLDSVINSTYNASYGSVSNADVATMVAANLGLTGALATAARDFIIGELNAAAAGTKGSTLANLINLFAGLTADPAFGAAAASYNAKVAAAVIYQSTPGTVDSAFVGVGAGTSFDLTTSRDLLTGTAGDDTFNAYIIDNHNSLQSADVINGGAGIDTLFADMGSSQSLAVTPITSGVEVIKIRAQSAATDSGSNNVANTGRVQIDAQRMTGVNRLESNNSRADLVVEDVRILSTQITKDVTIAFVQGDPGNVDFGVYFDQPSLTALRTSSSTLTLQILDQRAAAEGANPLRDSPYDGFSFSLNGQNIQLTSAAFNEAQTYAALLTAIQALLAGNPATAGRVTASLGSTFSVVESSGVTVQGTSIVLTATNATLGTGNWIALAGVPPTSSLYTNQFTVSGESADLITSTIILDDVGRGSTGGSLVVGGLSTGSTSSSGGVERFEITVERTSRLQNIDSTNNSLKEVFVRNGGPASASLTVLGNTTTVDGSLPGASKDDYGFNDVRLIDGSTMTGAFTFDALVSTASFGKYITITDTQPDPGGDNPSTPGTTTQRADFIYSGGSANDSITVDVEPTITASNSTVQVGREDFSFVINGNGGNDAINFRVLTNDYSGGAPAAAPNWYLQQKANANVTINGGAGNDTIRKPGAGDVRINGGDGNDTIYADNSGAQQGLAFFAGAITNPAAAPAYPGPGARAVWVMNSSNQATALQPQRNLNDIASGANDSNVTATAGVVTSSLFRATVEVNFLGLTASTSLPSGVFRPNDLFINQAIKSAINNDAVLNKLIRAEDGPGFSLVVKSLIDGVRTEGNLSVTFTALQAADVSRLSETEFQAVIANYGLAANSTRADLQTILNAGIANKNGLGDYVPRLGNDGATEVTGAASITPSDNTINGGDGNDVIVLGTTERVSALESSNDTVVYTNAAFGNDVIVNFDLDGLGIDRLNFSALGGTGGANLTNDVAIAGLFAGNGSNAWVNNAIILDNLITGAGGNDTTAKVQALFGDSLSTTVAKTAVYVVVDTATNIGTVYRISDPVGASGNTTATLMGTIDLADTLWAGLTGANFV